MNGLRTLSGVLLGFIAILAMLEAGALSALQPEKHEMIRRGQVSYQLYCQNCHGESGKGDGPMAKLLKVPPADLTLISARHDGRFPARRIYNTIVGSREVIGHGSREMPIWGDAFTPEGERELSDAKINEIIEYLKSIQAEQRAEGENSRSKVALPKKASCPKIPLSAQKIEFASCHLYFCIPIKPEQPAWL